ncbi:EAL domain-containing protein [Vibrio sp. SCSIO 43135]|uniref:bifunctional diguanylate cyclase/phosphodiesterase n=1 Tax=Vibrio sp. SCSIO 43135 TaxID=2819096 RepID=UPI0020764D38|nr:EAL domain-containing protein [Vibrio sp. SCSIO 43135]USD42168.1 EAL domain-containing protein [Vibrio sp. SCSIO 43135]
MYKVSDVKLVKIVRYFPFLIVSMFVLALVVLLTHHNQQKTRILVDGLRADFIASQKAAVQQRVDAIIDKMNFEHAQTVNILESDIRTRVLEAHQIVQHIYESNRELRKSEITQRIYQALKPIRFNQQRGYFFVFTMQGVNVLHPLLPQIEGQSKIGLKDVHGTPILKEHIDLIAESDIGEAFYRWWFRKPGFGDLEFEKIGFGKRFEPYDWFIGTGEYVVDVENDIRNGLLLWLSGYTFENKGSVVVLDEEKTVISHIDNSKVGQKWQFADKLAGQNFIEGGQFIDMTQANDANPALFYVYHYPRWNWTLIASVPVTRIDSYLVDKEQTLVEEGKQALNKILIVCLVFALISSAISLWLGSYINRRFYAFKNNIQDNINQLEKSKEQLQYYAHFDSLTGLANRFKLSEDIEAAIKRCREQNSMLAVMFVDLDDFKKVNDQHGHRVGDELIQLISRKLETLTTEQDTVARFGGDEFILCFANMNSLEEITEKSQQILALVNDTVLLNGVRLKVSGSVGISTYPADGENEQQLISKADIVLYQVKGRQKGTALFYNEDINQHVQRQFLVEDELANALQRDEISVVYQPQVDGVTGELKAVEALCRWSNDNLGFVPPDEFIPVAESKGLIDAIGDYVFLKACTDVQRFCQLTQLKIGVSVNFSPIQLLEPEIVDRLLGMVEQSGIDTEQVTIEITENILIHDLVSTRPILEQLRTAGFGISLDDFGTGYCSLRYLNQLPISEIKIDRAFINEVAVNLQGEGVVRSILAVAEVSGLITVAEGVETEQQSKWLKASGCQLLQGYLFDKPLAFEDLLHRYGDKVSGSHTSA